MKIIDLDMLRDDYYCRVAGKWISDSLVPVKTDHGPKMVPGEAIYFFSTHTPTPYLEAKAKKLVHKEIPPSNYWTGTSITNLLERMLDGLNSERRKYGLRESRKFDPGAPSRVWVLTDREFDSIERLGAIPLPVRIITRGTDGHV